MELEETVDDRGRLARPLLAVALGVVAIASLRRGRRLVGVLAGAGAVALGASARAGPRDLTEKLGSDTSGGDGELRCSSCGDPITPGQSRRPNADNETVHEDCLAS